MKTFNLPAYRFWVLIVLAMYLASFFLPMSRLLMLSDALDGDPISGWTYFWLTLGLTLDNSRDSVFWLPNLFLWIGLYTLWTSRPGMASGFGSVAFALAVITVPVADSSLFVGTFFWLGSMAVLTGSGLVLWERKKCF